MSIDQDADLAEYLLAQSRRELKQHPLPQIRADFDRRGFCLVAVTGEPIGKVYSQYKFAALAREWLRDAIRAS